MNYIKTPSHLPNDESDYIGLTILIIDDNADNRLLLASQLGMYGYKILEAEAPLIGLDIALKQQPDLILLDVMMPIMNGFEVCERLKENPETQLIPVIMVTALRDLEYRIQGINVGADEFLSRPHNKEELRVRVRALIRLRQTQQNLKQERNRLGLLHEVTRAISDTGLDLTQTLNEVMSGTKEVFEATRGNLFLLSPEGLLTDRITIQEDSKVEHSVNVNWEVFHQGLAGRVIEEKKSVIINDTKTDPRWLRLPDDIGDIGSAVATPLINGADIEGVLILMHQDQGHFKNEDRDLLETVAGQVAVAIRNATLFREMDEQRKRMTTILSQSSEAIILLSENKKIELINNAALDVFGSDLSKYTNQSIKEVAQLRMLDPLFATAEHTTHQTLEIQVPPQKYFLASLTPVSNVGYILFMQDITLRKREEDFKLEEARSENERVMQTFSRYMSPRLVNQVLANPEMMAQRKSQDAIVLFADLRGSIKMIVSLTPEDSIEILNDFFSQMTAIVYKMDGTIFDLAGDELMIGFNAPFEQVDGTQKAIETAIQMQRLFNDMQKRWLDTYGVLLGLGIGIDRGFVVMGNVGAESRLNFALVGEAVHTAHRLVDIAADGEVVISESIYQTGNLLASNGVPEGHSSLCFESQGYKQLKGKPNPEPIYTAIIHRP
ncbi:MAG: CheY-like chemotaxis protein/class 3 adenylate cyclase [Cellvibrionaceae bacterium]|jgi:CheY-like chemotaxis protein/class 3 adenylate cyclase